MCDLQGKWQLCHHSKISLKVKKDATVLWLDEHLKVKTIQDKSYKWLKIRDTNYHVWQRGMKICFATKKTRIKAVLQESVGLCSDASSRIFLSEEQCSGCSTCRLCSTDLHVWKTAASARLLPSILMLYAHLALLPTDQQQCFNHTRHTQTARSNKITFPNYHMQMSVAVGSSWGRDAGLMLF